MLNSPFSPIVCTGFGYHHIMLPRFCHHHLARAKCNYCPIALIIHKQSLHLFQAISSSTPILSLDSGFIILILSLSLFSVSYQVHKTQGTTRTSFKKQTTFYDFSTPRRLSPTTASTADSIFFQH